MAADPDVTDPLAFARFVRGLGSGIVATVAPDGSPQAALVGLAALDDGTLVLDAPTSGRTVRNLTAAPRVAVVVGVGATTVQVEGEARTVHDDERARFAAAYESQLPGSRVWSDEFAVVVVRPRWLRAYDTTQDPPAVTEVAW